jgi:hypothetical protein
MDVILRTKAVECEASAIQRHAVLAGKYPSLSNTLEELTKLSRQVAQKTLAGPGPEGPQAHQEVLREWSDRRRELEAELCRKIPEMNLDRKLRAEDHRGVALALPEKAVLIEFVRTAVFNFHAVIARGEPRWKPARYLAFVIMAGEPDRARMIDL